jgi:hypothetical protein
MEPGSTTEQSRLNDLAKSLDCLTEQDLCTLTGIAPATAEGWRKRRKGPAYILAGNRYLYPRKCVSRWLELHTRESSSVIRGAL